MVREKESSKLNAIILFGFPYCFSHFPALPSVFEHTYYTCNIYIRRIGVGMFLSPSSYVFVYNIIFYRDFYRMKSYFTKLLDSLRLPILSLFLLHSFSISLKSTSCEIGSFIKIPKPTTHTHTHHTYTHVEKIVEKTSPPVSLILLL